MRILALDLGERRIGLAICDEEETIAAPLDVIHRGKSLQADLTSIVTRAQEEGAGEIVVGMPTPLRGGTNAQHAAVQRFVAALRRVSPIPVAVADERLTTRIAEGALLEGGVRRKRRKEVIDKVAAALILEGYLARRQRGCT